jgi:IclR family transcriptional regulator, acetate operon repressor
VSVKQILNALDLIEFFARTKKPASLADIQQQFGWPRSSTYNILSTLVERGYMYEPARRGGGYYPTPRWQHIAQLIVDADGLNEQLSELLKELAAETGETVVVAAPAGSFSVYLEVIESQAAIRYTTHTGVRIPIHASASGRALLSLYSASERQQILGKVSFEPYGTNALMSIEAVEREIEDSLERGWFQSLHEYDADLAAIALPVNVDGRRLAITITGPVFRLGTQCSEAAETLKRLIDRHLGAHAATPGQQRRAKQAGRGRAIPAT